MTYCLLPIDVDNVYNFIGYEVIFIDAPSFMTFFN